MLPADPSALFHFVAALVLGAVAVAVLWRNQRTVLWSFLMVVVLSGARFAPFSTRPLLENVGFTALGVSFYPLDLFTAFFLIAGLIRLPSSRLPRLFVALWASIGLLTLTLLASLSAAHGFASAVNGCRAYMLILGVSLWSATVPRAWERSSLHAVVFSGLLATVLSIASYLAFGFGSNLDELAVGGQALSARPTTASVALLTLTALIAVAAGVSTGGVWRWPLTGLLAASVLLQQHRSVWIAAIMTLLIGVTWIAVRRGHQRASLITAALIAVALAPLLYRWLQGSRQLAVSATSTGTWLWRTERWADAVSWQRSAGDWLFGTIVVPDRVPRFGVSAHSLYLDALERLGLLGVLLLLMLWVWTLTASGGLGWPRVMAVATCISGFLAFAVSYVLPGWSYLLVGGVAASRRFTSNEAPAALQQPRRPNSSVGAIKTPGDHVTGTARR